MPLRHRILRRLSRAGTMLDDLRFWQCRAGAVILTKKMAAFLLILLSLLTPPFSCSGHPSLVILLSPSVQPSLPSLRERSAEDGRLLLVGVINPQRKLLRRRHFKSTLQPSSAPASSPIYSVPVAVPTISPLPHRHGHHHHHRKPRAPAPSPLQGPGCDQNCDEPLTTTPFGSPCGCVLPMKVRLLLDVAPYAVFPVMNELEIEIAAGTYLQQSQVKIMGASADSQNQGRTVVDINLVPLGDKFDNTTATLIHERFWHRKVPLNVSLFGNYEMIAVDYTSIPSSPFYPSGMGNGPSDNALPIFANFGNKNPKMDVKTIIIISLSAFVLLSVLVAALFLCLKWKKFGRPSSAVGPAFASSMNKRSGLGSMLSSSTASSASGSILSNMAPCMLSVKTFSLPEIEKATNKFSSKQILGEGGFGRVYQGTMEDGTEVAVKLLTRDRNKDGDREFIAEVEMLSRLHHRNLVKLIGICIEGHKRCLVYEVVRNGSVESHLHGVDKEKAPLDWDSRLKIALGAARGLAYLHEDSNPRVIHRDFKASNVLLEDDFTPKVSDFGLAKEATEGSQHISTRVMGTFGYVAPEYAMTGHLLVKSDVYSYGVVLLELITGRKPVDMSQPQGQENLVSWARPLLATQQGLEQLVDPTLTYNFEDMAKVAAIASMCVHQEVTNRPFMGEVVQSLKLIYNDAAGDDYCSQKDGSVPDSDSQGYLASWDATPRRKGHASSFITMDYSSGPLDDVENRGFSGSSFDCNGVFLPVKHGNRSGPLRTVRSKPAFYRLRGGSVSEHGVRLSKRSIWN